MATIALVTGANKGIGLEIARGLGRSGSLVLIGSRDAGRGQNAVKDLEAEGIRAQVIQLDVTDSASVQSAAKHIAAQYGHLDILVNNAGVLLDRGQLPSTIDLDTVRRTYEVNVFGVIAVTQAMLPLLRKSAAARIVNLSSALGSIATVGDPRFNWPPTLAYCSSKSALNAITVQFANELRGTGIKVNAACPGYCATDMNDHSGPRTPRQGAATPIRLATLPDDGPTGGLFDDDGSVPW